MISRSFIPIFILIILQLCVYAAPEPGVADLSSGENVPQSQHDKPRMFGVDPKGDIRVEGKVGGEGKLEGDDNKNEKQKASSSSNKPSGNTASSKAHNTATATVGIPAGSGGKSLGNHENDKGHKAFVPHPHIPPPKSPPTTPLHLPPTGFTLAAHVIVITSSGRSSFSPSSPSFKYEENEEGNWLHTRDLKVGKAQVSHAPMGATGDWIRSSVAGQHGGGDLVTCK